MRPPTRKHRDSGRGRTLESTKFPTYPLSSRQTTRVFGVPVGVPRPSQTISVGPLDRIRPGEPCFRHRTSSRASANYWSADEK
jgi:hypothetical protein